MKFWRKLTIGFLLIFISIQLIRPEKNNTKLSSAARIDSLYKVPVNIQILFSDACYDCHSNNTKYPWYAEIQPFGWIISNHVSKGKKELNFDEFGTYSLKRRKSKLKAIADQVRDGEMPLLSYRWLHTKARLTEIQKNNLLNWIDRATKL